MVRQRSRPRDPLGSIGVTKDTLRPAPALPNSRPCLRKKSGTMRLSHPFPLLASAVVGFVVIGFATAGPLAAQVSQESVFSVVTRKGGVAGRLAHNHLVVATDFTAELTMADGDPMSTSFEFSTAAEGLIIDDSLWVATLEPRIQALGIVDNLSYPDEGQRREIREKMLDDEQLDPEEYPTISARLVHVEEADSVVGSVPFTHRATVAVTIHGVEVERVFPARYDLEGDDLRFEAIGEFEFKEFGIDPYSAFLGTVKVKNEFAIYVDLRWTPPPPGSSDRTDFGTSARPGVRPTH